jgi:transcription elongation factor Elf1
MVRNQFSKWNSVKVKARHNYTCTKCGSTENIQAHDPTKEHKDWQTGIALCGSCHAKEHPDVPVGIFLAKNKQPYWYNISARTIAKNIGCHNRTVIRIAKRLDITPYCEISDNDIDRIRKWYLNKGREWDNTLYSDSNMIKLCPECNSQKLIKYGERFKMNYEINKKVKIQQYQCKECGRITHKPKGEVK